nr:unnamed protein product [Digitaria exilis]
MRIRTNRAHIEYQSVVATKNRGGEGKEEKGAATPHPAGGARKGSRLLQAEGAAHAGSLLHAEGATHRGSLSDGGQAERGAPRGGSSSRELEALAAMADVELGRRRTGEATPPLHACSPPQTAASGRDREREAAETPRERGRVERVGDDEGERCHAAAACLLASPDGGVGKGSRKRSGGDAEGERTRREMWGREGGWG